MLSYIVSDLRCIWHRQFVAHRSLPPARRRFNGVVQQVTPADIVSIIMLTNRLAESNNYHQYCMQIACKYASVYIYQQVWPLCSHVWSTAQKHWPLLANSLWQRALLPRPFACQGWQSCRTLLNPIRFMQRRTSRPTTIDNPVQRLSTQVAWNGCNGQRQASSILDGMEIGA